MSEFQNKTVIVTGGARGIGKACVQAFGELGANVAFTFNSSRNQALEFESRLKDSNIKALAIQVDVKDYNQCKLAVDKTISSFGRVDILINNAGIIKDRALVMMELKDWDEVIDTNLGGVFNMAKSVIYPLLKQKEGCIINIGSISGIIGLARQTNYSASKAAIIGFSKALAKEAAVYNVRVNVVCPGYIETDMLNGFKEDTKLEIIKNIPLKRIGSPRDVASVCVFLASQKANYITGEVIKVDGGLAI